jgi:hypothetical protein
MLGLGLLGGVGIANADTQLQIDGKGTGRVFDGLGACSGGGGNTRLLIDYPDAQRNELLDFLFKPNFGASLQTLKVEIGGDMNSTDGSEPSSEPVKGKEDYKRGYEWWLMQQAKARNPGITLGALSWGAPGWIGNGNYWSQDNIDFKIRWIKHAQSDYGLTINNIGGWNEVGYDQSASATWFINFKKALVAAGIDAKTVAFDDNNWNNLPDLLGNTALLNSVDVIGEHYPQDGVSPASAQQSGKVLWASEWGSENLNSGAGKIARQINLGYINGRLTAYSFWAMIWSVYSGMPYEGNGLMIANTPWSGHYELGRTIWVLAHTTQFTHPGWQYLDNACGFLGGDIGNGSYVTLKSPSDSNYSIIVETVNAGGDQAFTFKPSTDLKAGTVHVWRTDLNSSNAADYFVKQPDLKATTGSYTMTLNKGCSYSFTTTTGQVKGTTNPPASKSMAIPYYDNFDGYTKSQEARLFSDMNGAFVVDSCVGGRTGMCLAQTVPTKPITWNNFTGVISIAGDRDWTDYQVQCDVLLQQAGAAQILGRMSGLYDQSTVPGYFFEISSTGGWRLFKRETNRNETSLSSGTKSFPVGTWHTLKMVFKGSNIEGWIDGSKVATTTDGTFSSGNSGVGTNDYNLAQFDNFSITAPGSVVDGLQGKEHATAVHTGLGTFQPATGTWLAPAKSAGKGQVDALGKVHEITPPIIPQESAR